MATWSAIFCGPKTVTFAKSAHFLHLYITFGEKIYPDFHKVEFCPEIGISKTYLYTYNQRCQLWHVAHSFLVAFLLELSWSLVKSRYFGPLCHLQCLSIWGLKAHLSPLYLLSIEHWANINVSKNIYIYFPHCTLLHQIDIKESDKIYFAIQTWNMV